MTATFADYVAQQDARNTIQLNVTKWCYMLIDALKDNYREYAIRGHQKFVGTDADTHEYHQRKIDELKSGKTDIDYVIESGKKYHKIIMIDGGGSRSVHAYKCPIQSESDEGDKIHPHNHNTHKHTHVSDHDEEFQRRFCDVERTDSETKWQHPHRGVYDNRIR